MEELNGNGKTAFARFETVRSVLAPDQPFMRSIVSFLARKAYKINRSVQFTTSPFVIACLSFSIVSVHVFRDKAETVKIM